MTTSDSTSSAAPEGLLGIGVVEPLDGASPPFVVTDIGLSRDDGPLMPNEDRGTGPWKAGVEPLFSSAFGFRSRRPPSTEPEGPDGAVIFHLDDRAFRFRQLQSSDAPLLSRFDIGVDRFALEQLVEALDAVRGPEELHTAEQWGAFLADLPAVDELYALVAPGGATIFALHYLIHEDGTVRLPLFRDEGSWTEDFPSWGERWRGEAERVIRDGHLTPDLAGLGPDEDPAADEFQLLGASEMVRIHPTLAATVVDLFDRDEPVPALVAHVASMSAGDLVSLDDVIAAASENSEANLIRPDSMDSTRRMPRTVLLHALYALHRGGSSEQGDPSSQGSTIPDDGAISITETPGLRISRVRAPVWLKGWKESGGQESSLWRSLGEQPEWGFAIPMMWRVLSSPSTGEPFVAAPAAASHKLEALGYWTALLNLLMYSFGWRRPDVGLRWVRREGRTHEDLRIRMIQAVWEQDGQLDWFAAHLDRWGGLQDWDGRLEAVMGPLRRDPVHEEQFADVMQAAEDSGIPNPLSGGSDPLHLSAHLDGPVREEHAGPWRLLRSDAGERTAILQVEALTGWYRNLARAGGGLPDLGDRSWHVHVHSTTAGYLGMFRRSRATGLWFSGPHHLHTVGNP